MTHIQQLITDHLDIWTSAETEKKSGRGRSSGNGDTVYGIKKLRELILELAVRGKLVPQDPKDEPASELLKRIQAEKARLVKEGKIKKEKPLAEIGDEEKPFDLPAGWSFVRLVELLSKIGAGSTPLGGKQVYVDQGIPFLRSQNVWDEGLRLDDVAYIEPETHEKMSGTHVYSGDLLFNITGASIGRCAIVPPAFEVGNVSQHVTIVRPVAGEILEYLHLVLISRHVQQTVMNVQVGVSREGLSIGKLAQFVIPIAPLPEQHRIVAKVDELMALCDQLETQHNNATDAHEKLVTHLLGTLTQSQNADDFAANWQCIAEHFDILFTTEHSIDTLKQTLLQLAVMGKLVPQDPNDEPVERLQRTMDSHRQTRIAKKEIQKSKSTSTDTNPGLEIPSTWKYMLLGDLAFVTKLAGFEYTKYFQLQDEGDVPVIRAQNVRPFDPDLRNLKYIDAETSRNLPRSALDRPALLVTFIGAGIGDVCLLDQNCRWHLAPNVAKVEPFEGINIKFLNLFLNSLEGHRELFKFLKSTAQPSLSMGTIREIWVPIPPRQEQERIVRKTSEIRDFCDQLKSRITESNQLKQKLADALVEQSVSAT